MPSARRPQPSERPAPAGPRLRYRGRPAQHAYSRERRRAILEAALRLIVRDGMRGVRHRAIAQEAKVPLAATTYYFEDLSDLIADAFTLYAEDTLSGSRQLEESSLAALEALGADAARSPSTRAALARTLAEHLVAHIRSQVRLRNDRVLEHAFRNEALRNPKLAATARIPQARTLQAIADFLARCGSDDPDADAQIIFGFILHLEYQVLTGAADDALIERTVRRLVRHVFGASAR